MIQFSKKSRPFNLAATCKTVRKVCQHHSPIEWPASRGWQEQIQCRCRVGLTSAREDDQDDVSSPRQVNDRMLGQLGNVGRCVLESPE